MRKYKGVQLRQPESRVMFLSSMHRLMVLYICKNFQVAILKPCLRCGADRKCYCLNFGLLM